MIEMNRRWKIKLFGTVAWLVFVLAFAGWWMYFGLTQIDQLGQLLPQASESVVRHRRMMIWEGLAWMVLLLAGGLTLIFLVMREERRASDLKRFFAAFSHDVKTSLASLRLQAESLKEDLGSKDLPVLDRLVADTVRLHLQLQNSLFLASREDMKLFLETLSLRKIVASLQNQWPGIKLGLARECLVQADERALSSVLSNLIQNSVVHGDATDFNLVPEREIDGRVTIGFADNGKGFNGDFSRLGQMFFRQNPTSGSGVGLYICRQLMSSMSGQIDFSPHPGQPLSGHLRLPGKIS